MKAIEALQHVDGGYGYWSSDSCSSTHGSAYAVLALGRAAEVGYPVDRDALRRGQQFLAKVAAGNVTPCSWWTHVVDAGTRAFAVYALARTGAPQASSATALFARRAELPFYGKAMLADALWIGGGDRAAARQLTTELMDRATETSGTLHLEEMSGITYQSDWSSDLRTTAIALQTLVDVTPDHPYVGQDGALPGPGPRAGRPVQDDPGGRLRADGAHRGGPDAREGRSGLPGEGARRAASRSPSPSSTAGAWTSSGRCCRCRSCRSSGSRRRSSSSATGRPASSRTPRSCATRRSEMPRNALDRGLVVQRWIEPYAGGGQLKAVKAGELVRIKVRVGTPSARTNVVLEIPLPAGLEAVDTSLATTARLSRGEPSPDTETEEMQDAREADVPPWVLGFWNPFNHTELRDDRALFFSNELPPGVHTVSVVARATTPGDYLLVPARAEAMYAPEVFGRSDGSNFQVLVEGNVAAR